MNPAASHPFPTSGADASWTGDDLFESAAAIAGAASPASGSGEFARHLPLSSDVIVQTLGRPSGDPSRATLQLAALTALPGWPASLRIHATHPGHVVPVLHGRMPNGPWVNDHDLHLERRADGSWRARGPAPAMAWFDIPSTLPEPALAAAVTALLRNGHETLGLLATMLGHPGRQVRLIDRTFEALHARIARAYEAGEVPPGRCHLPRQPAAGAGPTVSAPPDRS